MKIERPKVGLEILIFNNENEILLGKRKGVHGVDMWGPPGGHLELGETFEQYAVREVFEETGLNVSEPKFLALTNDFFASENKHYVSIFMTVKDPINQQIKNKEPDRVESWQWFDINKLPTELFMPLFHLVSNKGYGNKIAENHLHLEALE
jgi:8-oxo-dGTP diphosphatase